MVEGLTDNRNRTAPEIKKIFERRGGALGASGCVGWMFKKRGIITVKANAIGEDELMDVALSSGADDMQNTGEVFEITCSPEAYNELKAALEAKKIPMESAEISMIPDTTVEVADQEVAQRILALIDEFEDHDDVQEVYANFDIPEEILNKIQ